MKSILKMILDSEKKKIRNLEEVTKANKASVNANNKTQACTWQDIQSKIDKETNIEKINQMYLNGINLLPNNPTILGNYATFLFLRGSDNEKAEEYFEKAICLDATDPINLSNYASFVYAVRQDKQKAKKLFKKAIDKYNENEISQNNYELYTIDHNSTEFNSFYSNLLGNYGALLREESSDPNTVYFYFTKAFEYDHKNLINIENLADYLMFDVKNYQEAEIFYKHAIDLGSKNEDLFGIYASLLHQFKYDYQSAEEYYLKALSINNSPINLGNYAKLLIELRRSDEALPYLEKSLNFLDTDKNEELELVFTFIAYAIFSDIFPLAKKKIEKLIARNITSPDENLDIILQVAKEKNHKNFKLLTNYAKYINSK